jgi:glyceraldehyde 3-phosphate dehydrogenase
MLYLHLPDGVRINEHHLHARDKKIFFFSEKDPAKLRWKYLKIDVVIESTGFFTKREGAEKHILAGASTVVI